jgi:alpha-beta hydrolase superfamily lysophospholipase
VEESVSFSSHGNLLSGIVSLPAGLGGKRRPAIAILHGFGGHKAGPQQLWSQKFFNELGYVTLRFDFRGCGESAGERGLVLPLDQVADTRAAVSFLVTRRDVDPMNIALSGTSYGAAVAVYAAGIDLRVAAVIAQGGWASGERMFRAVHAGPAQWRRFSDLLLRARARAPNDPGKERRFDIIHVPERLRANIDARSIMEFPAETVLATLAFNPGDVAGRIAPRPLLILHSARDEVISAEGSIDLFRCAGNHGDLHVLGGVDHFMFGEDDARVADIVRNWLKRSLPLGTA